MPPTEGVLSDEQLQAFLRRNTHDICNALNSVELELTLLEECTGEPATREAAERMRTALVHAELLLRGFAAGLTDDAPSVVSVFDLWQRWGSDTRKSGITSVADWDLEEGFAIINTGVAAIRGLLNHLLAAASRLARHAPLRIVGTCRAPEPEFRIELAGAGSTPAPAPDSDSVRLWRALVRIAAHHGARLEPEELSAGEPFPLRLRLPAVASA